MGFNYKKAIKLYKEEDREPVSIVRELGGKRKEYKEFVKRIRGDYIDLGN